MEEGKRDERQCDVLRLREAVIKLRAAYRKGDTDLGTLYRVADEYLDAAEAKAKRLWPGRKFRRPTTAYIVRAL